MVVISGRSGKYSCGMVEVVVGSHVYPAWYVAHFIRVLDQCNIVGALETYSGCQRRAVVDIFYCLCSKNARFQIMSAYQEFSPCNSQLTTHLGRHWWMQPRHLLAVKCRVIVLLKENCDKDDMLRCYHPAFIIANSFRETFERIMYSSSSFLFLPLCVWRPMH